MVRSKAEREPLARGQSVLCQRRNCFWVALASVGTDADRSYPQDSAGLV